MSRPKASQTRGWPGSLRMTMPLQAPMPSHRMLCPAVTSGSVVTPTGIVTRKRVSFCAGRRVGRADALQDQLRHAVGALVEDGHQANVRAGDGHEALRPVQQHVVEEQRAAPDEAPGRIVDGQLGGRAEGVLVEGDSHRRAAGR